MSTKKRILSAVVYTIINIFGSSLPFILAILYPIVFGEEAQTLTELVGKGEITIMCIPMCISIAFILYNYKKEIGITKWADGVYIITFFLLIVAAGLYAYGINKIDYPKAGITKFSIFFFAWTVISMMIAKFIEDGNTESITNARTNDMENLEDRFKRNRR